MIKFDMHIHTCYSKDSLISLSKLSEFCQKRNIKAVAITDHNTTKGAIEFEKHTSLKVIIGEEILTKRGEITGLYLKEEIPPFLSLEETISKIREQGGLIYLPHPFDKNRKTALKISLLDPAWREIDIIEVFNSRCISQLANERAYEICKTKGLLPGAGSDAHSPWEIGNACVELEDFSSKEELLKGLKKATIHGKQISPILRSMVKVGKTAKKYWYLINNRET